MMQCNLQTGTLRKLRWLEFIDFQSSFASVEFSEVLHEPSMSTGRSVDLLCDWRDEKLWKSYPSPTRSAKDADELVSSADEMPFTEGELL